MSENQGTDTTMTDVTFAPATAGETTCRVIHTDGERCAAPIYARRIGLCSKHYVAHRAGKSLDSKVKPVTQTVCTADGCERPIYAKRVGLCSKHYVEGRKAAAVAAAAAAEQQSA